jgi:hypothetical protein
MAGTKLESFPAHLGLGASVEIEPRFTGSMDWYQGYIGRHQGDGAEGRLVSMHTFNSPWDMWEMHPRGAELVLCLAGSIDLHQEAPDGAVTTVALHSGEYAVNARGVWHTADVRGEATALFITAGLDTQHRPRKA